MLWHVLAPHTDGGHNSIDYTETLTHALELARYWRRNLGEDLALAKGPNGEPLRYVVYYRRFAFRDVGVSVHATVLGAKRAYLKLGRTFVEDDDGEGDRRIVEYGFRRVGEW